MSLQTFSGMPWRSTSHIAIERVGIAFALLAGSLTLVVSAAPLRADEAYLCGSDRIVYVAVADLERMKRTDPCIASYYGLKIEDPAKQAKAATAALPPPAAESATQQPEVAAVPPQPAAPPVLKRLAEEKLVPRAKPAAKLAMAEPPRAAPETDFRNVKVLNAALPEDAIFHHTR